MQSTMMSYPLTLPHLLERAGRYFAKSEIVSRLPDRSFIAPPMATSIGGRGRWPPPWSGRA